MTKPISALRSDTSDLVNRVAYGGERVVFSRHGKAIVALVSVADLKAIEAAEDKIDIAAVRKFRKARERGKAKTTEWGKAKRELGL